MIDQTIAHFRITAKLGEGGMGTVYRAEDAKLGRAVALKFLPESLAADADRMARFTREAQVLASLNHPNIAGIFSVEEAPREGSDVPLRFLVMELVEGETLQERIARGPLDVDEAIGITLQLANGLEEAHERGIIHRDLKPANIKLTPGKQVKILDFGLAKAFDPDSPGNSISSGSGIQRLSLSPTMTGLETQVGMLLGTAAYMSPEQARGEPVDRRADIWALGVVLMEMLTGKIVHQGKTLSDPLAAGLARDPAWDELPADLPRPVYRLLERCLIKDSRERLRDVGEARIAIERFLAAPDAEDDAPHATDTATVAVAPLWKRVLPWAATAVLAGALLVTVVALRPAPLPPSPSVRLNLVLPFERYLFSGYGASAVLSPDGARMAYVSGAGTQHELYIQAFDQWEGTLLVDADGNARPYQPFFSPDGQWLGYVTPSELRKVPVSGGTPIRLCDVNRARGASWGPDGTIVFSPSPRGPLMQVADAGGEPRTLIELDEEKGEVTHRWPQWLPGGRALLFTSHTKTSDFDEANIELYFPATGERRVVQQGGTYGRYVSSGDDSGFVIYANAGSLFAIPFDANRLEATGSAAPVIEGVTSGTAEGSAQYSSSNDGKLAYASGVAGVEGRTLVWVDRKGVIEPLWADEQPYENPSLSPDGSRLAVDIVSEGQSDIWIYDIDRGVPTRLTFSEGEDTRAVWSPDGLYVYYSAELDGRFSVFRKSADGSGKRESVFGADRTEGGTYAASISDDGKFLAFDQDLGTSNWDVGILPLDGDAKPRMLATSPFLEATGRLSPNGRWLAFTSNESGEFEVYVVAVEGRGKWQISTGGGVWPHWSSDGNELFYWGNSRLFVADVESGGPTFRAGRARELFEGPFADTGLNNPFDVSRDGQQFVALRSTLASSTDSHQHVKIVMNWDKELNRTFGH